MNRWHVRMPSRSDSIKIQSVLAPDSKRSYRVAPRPLLRSVPAERFVPHDTFPPHSQMPGARFKTRYSRMTKQNSNSSPGTEHDAELSPALRARAQADQLFRAASESVRQRERYSKLVASSAEDSELESTLRLASLCDELLGQAAQSYEDAANADAGASAEPWRHSANALWIASREYTRRHREVNESSRKLGAHSPSKLTELALQYDLEASAILALDHALSEYRKHCPDADCAGQSAKRARAS